jgi:aspartokinase-like uncharacterized kinase
MLTTGGVVAARVRVMERVTGIFRTAAHAMAVVFEQIRTSASERHTVLMTQAVVDPLKAGSGRCRRQHIAAVNGDGDGI